MTCLSGGIEQHPHRLSVLHGFHDSGTLYHFLRHRLPHIWVRISCVQNGYGNFAVLLRFRNFGEMASFLLSCHHTKLPLAC
jgi:hypothetical protein